MPETPGLLDAARAGDARAFEALVAPYRSELRAHCYRMLGSLCDAEDAVQETLVRAWRSVSRLDERGLVRAWLHKIATNRCLSLLKDRGRRELPVALGSDAPPTEISWLGPYPDQSPEDRYVARESLELAYVAALQYLTPVQRATLILRDVLRFSAIEVAAQLDTSVPAVNSALQRARTAMHSASPTQQDVLRELGDARTAALASRWAAAWERADIDAIVAMLADDATYSMPPLIQWYNGTRAIRDFLVSGPLQSRWRFLPTTANGQVAFGTYLWDEALGHYTPGGLDVLTIANAQVVDVTAFLTAAPTHFGLPAHISP